MSQAELFEKFNRLPEPLQQEVLKYIDTLVEQTAGTVQTTGQPAKRGAFGIWKDKIKIAENFDEPLEEFKEYLE